MDIRTRSEGCRRKPDWADRFDGADAVARAPDRPVWLAAICSIILALSGVPTTALSASPEVPPEVRFVGLHGSKAQIRVDNRTYLLSIGERTREGVKLLSANRQQAVVRIGRRNYRFKRGDATGVGLSNRVSLRRRNGL